MVELQETIPKLELAGIAAYALSYDSIAILESFARDHGITLPLLSDNESVTIKRLGLLNPHVRRQHDETNELHEARFEGVPYPATFLLDEAGRVVDRRMHADYRIRETVSALVDSRFGFRADEPQALSFTGDVVNITVRPETDRFSPYQMIWVEVNVAIQPGWHVYGHPAPQGLRPLSVETEFRKYLQAGATLIDREPEIRNVAGTDQPTPTFEGTLHMRLPIVMATGRPQPVDVNGFVDYQACSSTECLPPARFNWSIRLQPREI